MKHIFLASSLLVSINGFSGDFFYEDSRNPDLDRAHQYYLDGNNSEMLQSAKQALMATNNDSLVAKNAAQLISEASKNNCGREIQVDWQLPDEMKWFSFSHKMRNSYDVNYKVALSGKVPNTVKIAQLRLVRYPDQVIIDHETGIGEFGKESDSDDPNNYRFYGTNNKKTPYADGLYLFEIKLSSGSHTKGWFIFTDLTAKESPVITSPAENQVFRTLTPTFSWKDFKSSNYKECEKRRMGLGVADPSKNWDDIWGFYTESPRITSIKVNRTDKDTYGVEKLHKGEFAFFLTYKEQRFFGPMMINRESQSNVDFVIE